MDRVEWSRESDAKSKWQNVRGVRVDFTLNQLSVHENHGQSGVGGARTLPYIARNYLRHSELKATCLYCSLPCPVDMHIYVQMIYRCVITGSRNASDLQRANHPGDFVFLKKLQWSS